MSDSTEHSGNAFRSRTKWAFFVFATIAAFFFFAEHRAHVFPFLPWLILLACPLMHIFMHGGHGSHHGGRTPLDAGKDADSAIKPERSGDSEASTSGARHSHHGVQS